MLLTQEEDKYVRSLGLFIREKCDACHKVLNQAFRYTAMNHPEVFCSAECRDAAFFPGRHQKATPGRLKAQGGVAVNLGQ